MGSSQLGTSANLIDAVIFTVALCLRPPPPPPSPSEPTTMAHAALHQWSQLGMILHVLSHWQRSGWRAAVWFPVSGSGSSADPCKSCSSDRSSSPRPPGTAVHQIHQVLGVHGGRPPAATMTLDRFVGPLSADSSPPPLPAIVAARGCRQGLQGRVRHARAPLRITPITSRVRGNSRVLLVYARVPWDAAWLRIPSVQGLVVTSQHREGDPHIICDSCYCGIRVQGSTVIDLRLIVPASLLREISLACLSALEACPAIPTSGLSSSSPT